MKTTHCIHNTYAVIMFPVDATCSTHLDYITHDTLYNLPRSPYLIVNVRISLNTYFYPALNQNNHWNSECFTRSFQN
jgi:hypothetical protein